MLRLPDEDEAIVDDCYEAATDASDYAGSVSGGDRDNDHDEHSPPEFYDDSMIPGAGRCRNPRTLGPAACSCFGPTKNMHACSYSECVFLFRVRVLIPSACSYSECVFL